MKLHEPSDISCPETAPDQFIHIPALSCLDNRLGLHRPTGSIGICSPFVRLAQSAEERRTQKGRHNAGFAARHRSRGGVARHRRATKKRGESPLQGKKEKGRKTRIC
eukprot:1703184-Karenia_brevis.AAC.1